MHINSQTLQDLLTEKLGPQERSQVEAHLATCTLCFAHSAVLRHSFEGASSEDFATPPPMLVQRAVAAFRHYHSQQAERVQTIAHLSAQGSSQARLGLRGTLPECQALYTTERHDIDIRQNFDQATNSVDLHGQILPHEDQAIALAGLEVCLLNAANMQRLRITDALGEFTFSHVPEGVYSLVIPLMWEDIVVKSIVVKSTTIE